MKYICSIYSLFKQGLFSGVGRALDLRLPKYSGPGSSLFVCVWIIWLYFLKMWDSLRVLPWVNTFSVLLALTPDVRRERIAKTNNFMTIIILFSLDETKHKTEKISLKMRKHGKWWRHLFPITTPSCFKDIATISEIHSNQFILVLNIPLSIRPHRDTSRLPTLIWRQGYIFWYEHSDILNYKRLCPSVCLSVRNTICITPQLSHWLSELNIQIPPAKAVTLI